MSIFIELHLKDAKKPPVIINVDRIVYVTPDRDSDGCYVRIGTREDGIFTGYYVMESYSFLKRELL